MREQLRGTGVKVIEVMPPAVQTELHDEKHQPDIKDGRNFGMPLGDFVEECWAGLSEGKEDVPVGTAKKSAEGWEKERRKAFEGTVKSMGGWS